VNGLISGIAWLEKQGQFVWNFRDGRIKFEDGEWLELQREEAPRRIRRVYICEDTYPNLWECQSEHQVTHRTPDDIPYIGMIEQGDIPSLDVVYTRSLLPAKFSDIQISFVNLENEDQVVPKGTDLGILYEAEVINIPEDDEDEIPKTSQIKADSSDSSQNKAREKHPLVGWSQVRRDGL